LERGVEVACRGFAGGIHPVVARTAEYCLLAGCTIWQRRGRRRGGTTSTSTTITGILILSLLSPVVAPLHLALVLTAVPTALPALGRPVLLTAHRLRRLRVIPLHDGTKPAKDGEGRQQREETPAAVGRREDNGDTVEQASFHPGSPRMRWRQAGELCGFLFAAA
jgi:hypothetical protein